MHCILVVSTSNIVEHGGNAKWRKGVWQNYVQSCDWCASSAELECTIAKGNKTYCLNVQHKNMEQKSFLVSRSLSYDNAQRYQILKLTEAESHWKIMFLFHCRVVKLTKLPRKLVYGGESLQVSYFVAYSIANFILHLQSFILCSCAYFAKNT